MVGGAGVDGVGGVGSGRVEMRKPDLSWFTKWPTSIG